MTNKKKVSLLILSVVIVVALLFFWLEGDKFARENFYSGTKKLSSSIMNTELKDIVTQETFKLSDFKGKVILIDSFHLSCEACMTQHSKEKLLIEERPDIVLISFDSNSTDSESQIGNYAVSNEYYWYFTQPPEKFVKSLSSLIGNEVTNARLVPTLVVCPDNYAHLLRTGAKPLGELKSEIVDKCR